MNSRLPLSTLLSQTLVAFIIEFDNEAGHRTPHRTTDHGVSQNGAPGSPHPWLVSMVMWMNCLRFVGEEGISVRELENVARTGTNLHGMQRWGYVVVKPDRSDKRPKPPQSAWIIHATRAGRLARETLRPLTGEIEDRWRERFGTDEIRKLRESLLAVARQLDAGLPDCLPILGYGLYSSEPLWAVNKRNKDKLKRAKQDAHNASPAHENLANQSLHDAMPLASLLSRVLLAFAIEYERDSEVSLAIGANVLRLAREAGTRVKDLPKLAGVSKEAIAIALSFLEKRGYAVVRPESSGSRTKLITLTAKGKLAQDQYLLLLGTLEQDWIARFGEEKIRSLRQSLEQLAGDATASKSPLFRGLKPYPEGWRASLPEPEVLPHFPMVLHRGGFPDGS